MGGQVSSEKVAIVDLGNDIQLTYSVSGFVYTLNKLQLRVKQTDKFVFITNADGFNNSPDNQVLRLDYLMVSSPVYASNDELYAGLIGMAGGVSLGGGGASAGGGASVWSTKQKDFITSTTDDTKNVSITGLSWTLEAENVAIVEKFESNGDKSTLALTNVIVSGGVITLGDIDDFASGDTVSVTLIGPDKAYDEGIDAGTVHVINPEYGHWTSPEHLVDLSAEGASDQLYVIPWESYKNGSIHYKIVNTNAGDTITLTMFATNNADADDSAVTDWVDVTTAMLGAASKSVNNASLEEIAFFNSNLTPLKFALRVVTATGGTDTNAVDVYIKKA